MAKSKKNRVDLAEVRKRFRSSLEEVAKILGKHPREVTKAEFFANDSRGVEYSPLTSAGGFASLRNMMFPPQDTDITFKHGSRMIESFRNKLEREYGRSSFLNDEFMAEIREEFKKSPIRLVRPAELRKGKTKSPRTIVAHLSDTHFGCEVSREETLLNEFNWTVAARRLALFVTQIADYKPQYRDDTDLVLCINGDIISGVIHDQEWFVHMLTTQFSGTVRYLCQAIGYLSKYYRRVSVKCSPGNHGRAMHKTSTERASTHKWDSYETMIYLAVKEVVERVYKNVTVDVPESPFVIFEAQGHLFLQTHGDTVFDVGNPGSSLNVKSINNQINKLNASQLGGDKTFAAIMVGHVHTPTLMMASESGTMLVINGCLSGLDPFALSIGFFSNHPTQQLFEVTEKFAVGDHRFISLSSADDRPELDSIITPFRERL